MAKKADPAPKKRNPQDATRGRDVAPLRRRVQALETEMRKVAQSVGELRNAVFHDHQP